MNAKKPLVLAAAAILAIYATSFRPSARAESLPDVGAWLSWELPRAESALSANISPNLPGFKRGFVVAAPWIVPGVQNYQYHWVRDAALVMNTILTRFIGAKDDASRAHYFAALRDYANFSKENQTAPEPANAEQVGLGEVKFNPDGTRYTNWMRPQNDGPALRAITLIRLAHEALRTGNPALARHLYDGQAPATNGVNAPGVIRADLDYVAAHWKDVSFDPWEEVKGVHFYTNLVQRKALLDGAALAQALGDAKIRDRNLGVVRGLESAIASHWIPAGSQLPTGATSPGQIWDTFGRVSGPDYKASGLDVASVLGALHAHNELDPRGDRFFSPSDPRVLQTAALLARAFRDEYPVARQTPSGFGTPIGRYPFDRYNGYDGSNPQGGNPWYLATAAFAELYYRCAQEWIADGKIAINPIDIDFLSSIVPFAVRPNDVIPSSDQRFGALVSSIRALGDSYLRQVILRTGNDGRLREEFSRNDGSPTGAVDLSWSYASILSVAGFRH